MPQRRPRSKPVDRAEAQQLYDELKSYRKVAKHLDSNYAAVYRALHPEPSNGIPPSEPGAPPARTTTTNRTNGSVNRSRHPTVHRNCMTSPHSWMWSKPSSPPCNGNRSSPAHRQCTQVAQFIAVCRRLKWSKHVTNSPLLALLATDGSNAACKINSACSKAFCCRTFRRN